MFSEKFHWSLFGEVELIAGDLARGLRVGSCDGFDRLIVFSSIATGNNNMVAVCVETPGGLETNARVTTRDDYVFRLVIVL